MSSAEMLHRLHLVPIRIASTLAAQLARWTPVPRSFSRQRGRSGWRVRMVRDRHARAVSFTTAGWWRRRVWGQVQQGYVVRDVAGCWKARGRVEVGDEPRGTCMGRALVALAVPVGSRLGRVVKSEAVDSSGPAREPDTCRHRQTRGVSERRGLDGGLGGETPDPARRGRSERLMQRVSAWSADAPGQHLSRCPVVGS